MLISVGGNAVAVGFHRFMHAKKLSGVYQLPDGGLLIDEGSFTA